MNQRSLNRIVADKSHSVIVGLYINRCPSVCIAKVISWHAFLNHLGKFTKIQ